MTKLNVKLASKMKSKPALNPILDWQFQW